MTQIKNHARDTGDVTSCMRDRCVTRWTTRALLRRFSIADFFFFASSVARMQGPMISFIF